MDPRWELVHQLLQYKKFKDAAATLAGLVETRQNLLLRYVSTLSSDAIDRPLKAVDRIELWNTFNMVLRRLAEKLVVGEIHDEMVTVTDQMEWLLERIETERSLRICRSSAAGSCDCSCGSSSLMASTTWTVLVPGWRAIAR